MEYMEIALRIEEPEWLEENSLLWNQLDDDQKVYDDQRIQLGNKALDRCARPSCFAYRAPATPLCKVHALAVRFNLTGF